MKGALFLTDSIICENWCKLNFWKGIFSCLRTPCSNSIWQWKAISCIFSPDVKFLQFSSKLCSLPASKHTSSTASSAPLCSFFSITLVWSFVMGRWGFETWPSLIEVQPATASAVVNTAATTSLAPALCFDLATYLVNLLCIFPYGITI